jgi:hypothetical protein
MELPCANKAIVDREIIKDYLLNPAHRFGASKARFASPALPRLFFLHLKAYRFPVKMCYICGMMPQQTIDDELTKKANFVLDSAGISDCRVTVGPYRRGSHIVHEARLDGGSDASRKKAKSLLPDINFPE